MNQQSGTVRLAVIDTDSGFVRVLAKRLEAAGWEHRLLTSTIPPDELVAMKVNALVVDPDALGPSAWEYLERVAQMLPDLGLVIVSQGSTVAQRVRGLRMGADDWVSKPCHPEEVIARVEAVTRRRRRGQPGAESGPVTAGELEIRPDQFQAFVAGRSLGLTRREFELVQTLAGAEGKVLEREEIYQRVWGYTMAHGDRSVDVFIRKLALQAPEGFAGMGLRTHALWSRLSIRGRGPGSNEPGAFRPRNQRSGGRSGPGVRAPREHSALVPSSVHTFFTRWSQTSNKIPSGR